MRLRNHFAVQPQAWNIGAVSDNAEFSHEMRRHPRFRGRFSQRPGRSGQYSTHAHDRQLGDRAARAWSE